MKTVILAIGLAIALVIQLFVLQSWQTSGIAPNVLLAFLVVSSIFVKSEQLLWLSLVAGVLSDFYSTSDFGLYLGFYLLVAIIAKYLLKFGETEFSWWRPLVFLAILCFLQAIVINFGQFSSLYWWAVTKSIIQYVVFTMFAGVIWYLIIKQADDFIKKLTVSRVAR